MVKKTDTIAILVLAVILVSVIVIGIITWPDRDRLCRGAGFDGIANYPNDETVNGVRYVKCKKTMLETIEPMLPSVTVEKWVKIRD